MNKNKNSTPVFTAVAAVFEELGDIQELVLRRREQGLPPADTALWDRLIRLKKVLTALTPASREDPEAAALLADTKRTAALLMDTLPEPGEREP
ncbi:MAG: hypothetical protein IKH77_09850 [Clostridia bacterium]|nr:hypothetical protein [Clostridia bacterium]